MPEQLTVMLAERPVTIVVEMPLSSTSSGTDSKDF